MDVLLTRSICLPLCHNVTSILENQLKAAYPFSESVIFPTQQLVAKAKDKPWSVMDRVNQSLILPSTSSFRNLFRKGSPERIPEGSIISVESFTGGSSPSTCNSTSSFAGVLMAVKRRHQGVDDAFTVRASVGKPGVGTEVRFDVNSPWIKNIKVLRKNEDFRWVLQQKSAIDFPLPFTDNDQLTYTFLTIFTDEPNYTTFVVQKSISLVFKAQSEIRRFAMLNSPIVLQVDLQISRRSQSKVARSKYKTEKAHQFAVIACSNCA